MDKVGSGEYLSICIIARDGDWVGQYRPARSLRELLDDWMKNQPSGPGWFDALSSCTASSALVVTAACSMTMMVENVG